MDAGLSRSELTERIRALQDALQQERDRWIKTFDGVNQSILIIDRNFQIVSANKATLALAGLSQPAIEGQKCHMLMHGSDAPPAGCPLKTLLADGAVGTAEMEVETLGRTFLVTCAPIQSINGGPEQFLHFAVDITEQKRAEAARKDLERNLYQARKMESIGTLAGGIAHEFNNLLSIMLGNCELAMDETGDSSAMAQYLNEINAAVLRARNVVRQLLTFSRMDHTPFERIDLKAVVEGAVKLIRTTISPDITIRLDMADAIAPIIANATHIHQLLLILSDNAADALTDRQAPTVRISLRNATTTGGTDPVDGTIGSGRYVQLVIEDNGIGMTQADISQIFEPYFTTKPVGSGTGMGLAVAHGIVKQHNGRIFVESVKGRGTTVTILIPALSDENGDGGAEVNSELSGSERILVVDDEPAIVAILKERLEKLGYRITGRTDPHAALKMVKENPSRFDMIITDMAMPDMNGAELASALMRIREDLFIILCTGYSDAISEKQAKEIGIAAFAMKPVHHQQLAATIRRVLDNGNFGLG